MYKRQIKHWKNYIEQLHKKGEKILASILEVDVPKIENTTIHLEFPNSTMKVELKRAQYPLLTYLRKRLNNYDVSLNIVVNETIQKKYAFTAREKFEKLNDLNPVLDILRKEFDLDI